MPTCAVEIGPHKVKTSLHVGAQAKAGSGGVTCLASGPRPGLVSGSREGIITSWATDSGVALQTIDVSHVHPGAAAARSPAKGARPWRHERLVFAYHCSTGCMHAPGTGSSPSTCTSSGIYWVRSARALKRRRSFI